MKPKVLLVGFFPVEDHIIESEDCQISIKPLFFVFFFFFEGDSEKQGLGKTS